MNRSVFIGLDASRSVTDQPTGTEVYSRRLIAALLARAPDRFAFRLYFNQSPQTKLGSQNSEFRRKQKTWNVRSGQFWLLNFGS